jgi:hypothetical protein
MPKCLIKSLIGFIIKILAVEDVQAKQLSQNEAAQKWGVPRTTLSDRIRDQGTARDQSQPTQHLSKNQESNLVSWILRQESLGYALSYSQIRTCVKALLRQQDLEVKLGCNWVPKFVRRYPELAQKTGRQQEANRFDSFTPKAVNWFFDIRENEYS